MEPGAMTASVTTLVDLPKSVLSYIFLQWLEINDIFTLRVVNSIVSDASSLALASIEELFVAENRPFFPKPFHQRLFSLQTPHRVTNTRHMTQANTSLNGFLLQGNERLLGFVQRFSGQNLSRLSVTDCPFIGITRDFLMGIATACPNLSHMVLERCGSLKPTDPRGALEAERRLGYSPGIFSSDSRNDGSRPSLSESFGSLTSLDAPALLALPLITEDLLTGPLRHRLKELSIRVPQELPKVEQTFRWVYGMSCLEKLSLMQMPSMLCPSWHLADGLLKSRLVQNLKSFELRGFSGCRVGNVGWRDMSQLQRLVIDGPQIQVEFADSIATAPNLLSLSLGFTFGASFGDEGIEKVSESCRKLRFVGHMLKATRFGFKCLAENCTMLEYLSVGYAGVGYHREVGDSTLSMLASKCPNLRYLNAQFCTDITDQGLVALCENVAPPSKLITIDLAQCTVLTDRALVAVSHCPVLENLRITYMHLVTDNGVLALADKCRTLKLFYAQGCDKISRRALLILAQKCTTLQYIIK